VRIASVFRETHQVATRHRAQLVCKLMWRHRLTVEAIEADFRLHGCK
jgi:hypothetical protein